MSVSSVKEGKKPESYGVSPFILVASSCSAIAARLVTHPIDTIRVRVQTWPSATLPPLKDLIRKPYAGLPVALVFSIPALSIYLTSYEISKKYLGTKFLPQDSKPSLLQQIPIFVSSGMIAEATSGGLWTILDVLKGRQQKANRSIPGNEASMSASKLLAKIWREEGAAGVWRGYFVSMVVFVPYISLYWSLYESFKTSFIQDYDAYRPFVTPIPSTTSNGFTIPLTLQYTLCSVSAVSISAAIVSPIDIVNTRYQTGGGKIENGISGIIKDIIRLNGWRGFTRGMSLRVAYAIPANAISMTVYESIKRYKGI